MARFSRKIGSATVVAQAAPALKAQAEWLLGTLEAANAKKKLADGQTVHVGWTTLMLRSQGGELHVHEPDYAGDPMEETRDDVTASLTVLAQQRDVLARTGAEGKAVNFTDKVVMARDVLDTAQVHLLRNADVSKGDSGWFVGYVDREPGDDLEAVWLYQLLERRPALLQVVTLPPGYLVVFDGDQIQSIDDPDGNDVWTQKAKPARKAKR